MTTLAQEIIAAHREHPDWTMPEITDWIGCRSEYVRVVKQRHRLNIPVAGRKSARESERRACALIAESMGHPDVARAIRERDV